MEGGEKGTYLSIHCFEFVADIHNDLFW